MTYLNFGRTSQIRTGDLYHVKAKRTPRDTVKHVRSYQPMHASASNREDQRRQSHHSNRNARCRPSSRFQRHFGLRGRVRCGPSSRACPVNHPISTRTLQRLDRMSHSNPDARFGRGVPQAAVPIWSAPHDGDSGRNRDAVTGKAWPCQYRLRAPSTRAYTALSARGDTLPCSGSATGSAGQIPARPCPS